jgi:hypothetical protein
MAVMMRNKIQLILLACICVLLSLVSGIPIKKINLKNEWENNSCRFPPASLYVEKDKSLKKCLNEELLEDNQAMNVSCNLFFQALNNDTCKQNVIRESHILETMEGANTDQVKQYCDGPLKSILRKDCVDVCTRDKFSTDMCTLIYLANNITETIRKLNKMLLCFLSECCEGKPNVH